MGESVELAPTIPDDMDAAADDSGGNTSTLPDVDAGGMAESNKLDEAAPGSPV